MLSPETGSGGCRLGRNIIVVIRPARVVAGGRQSGRCATDVWSLRDRCVVAARPSSACFACEYCCCAATGRPAPLAQGSPRGSPRARPRCSPRARTARPGLAGEPAHPPTLFFPLARLAERLKAIPAAEDPAHSRRFVLIPPALPHEKSPRNPLTSGSSASHNPPMRYVCLSILAIFVALGAFGCTFTGTLDLRVHTPQLEMPTK